MIRALATGVLFFAIASAVNAQIFRGGISGGVTDQTGAVVPGANVKAANEATGLSYDTISSTAGAFAFPDLPLGDYRVVVCHLQPSGAVGARTNRIECRGVRRRRHGRNDIDYGRQRLVDTDGAGPAVEPRQL